MFDLSQPIPNEVVIGSIIFIFGVVGVGLLVVKYFDKRNIKK